MLKAGKGARIALVTFVAVALFGAVSVVAGTSPLTDQAYAEVNGEEDGYWIGDSADRPKHVDISRCLSP